MSGPTGIINRPMVLIFLFSRTPEHAALSVWPFIFTHISHSTDIHGLKISSPVD
jgi:hypothetical protein